MARRIGWQILKFLLLMGAVSFAVFALVSMSPIDPVQANVGQAAYISMGEEKRAQLQEYWGANIPLLERYANWLGAILQGDAGMSLRFNAPVTEVIAQRAGNSLALMAVAWVLSGAIGFVMGVVAGVFRGHWPDRVMRGFCYVLASTPAFWLGLVALAVFSVWLGWFPLGFSVPIGMAAESVSAADLLHHMVLPALVLSITGVANIALHTREKTIDALESDYAKFARARGERTCALVFRHGLRNVALPAITLQFASISEIFGGSVLVEQVFSYPGLGQAAVSAGLGGDAALLAGIALVSAALVFGGNLVANILYGVIDPRMRLRATSRRRKRAMLSHRGCEEPGYRGCADAPGHAGKPPHACGSEDSAHVREFPCASDIEGPVLFHEPISGGTGNRLRTLIAFIFSFVALAAIVAGGLANTDAATAVDFAAKNLAPSIEHFFGTDWMGRDVFLRTISGLSTSILVGLLAAGASALIALVLGTAAAVGGRVVDAAITWLIDFMMGIPHIVLLILISFALGKGFWGVVIGVALTHWPSLARVVRAEVAQCRRSGFVQVARKLGKGRVSIAWRHMVPYVLPQFVVGLILLFPHAILHEAAITFLGFGLSPEQPAIGVILSEAMGYLSAGMWWLAVFPGAALVAVVLLFDCAGQSLRKLVDPHSNQE